MFNRFIILISLIVINKVSYSQNSGLAQQQYFIEDGDEYLGIKNYIKALDIYKELYKTISNNPELNYKIALCYLNTNINRLESIKYLEFVVKNRPEEGDAWLLLGKAYSLAYKLEDAIASYEKYKLLVPKKSFIADRKIEECHNAIALMKTPINVSFTNLGRELNSPYPDYYPWISKDETFMAFTSRRKGNIGGAIEGDGYYSSDIYVSSASNGKWIKSRNIGPAVNTALDEQVVGLKADGSEMLVYLDHADEYGNLYSSKRKGQLFQKIQPLAEQINKKIEHSGSVSQDGNTIFFVRKDKEKENTDIYMCRKLPTGIWAEPQKLSDNVNSIYNEDFPYLAIDGKTLYFSSEGHNSMGGFDLFKCEWDAETNSWSQAINLGYPVNTTDDDRSISVSPDNRVGYISAMRPGGFGDFDIYRIKFKDAQQKTIIYKGTISYNDSLRKSNVVVATITATDKNTNEEFTFTPNTNTGAFILALPAGTYSLIVVSEGYKDINETIVVSDIGATNIEKPKEFTFTKN